MLCDTANNASWIRVIYSLLSRHVAGERSRPANAGTGSRLGGMGFFSEVVEKVVIDCVHVSAAVQRRLLRSGACCGDALRLSYVATTMPATRSNHQPLRGASHLLLT
jgi:hypothetical protein